MEESDLLALLRGEDQPKNEFERACFDYVRAASDDPGGVPDDVYERLTAHLTPPQIVEFGLRRRLLENVQHQSRFTEDSR